MYTAPKLFQAAFSYRQFPKECGFLRDVARTWGGVATPSWIDWACGSAEHLRELAACGGARCVGVDISHETTQFARALCPTMPVICTDASRPVDLGETFDIAICLNDSISHFVANADVRGLFSNVVRHLGDHGVFVIETQHSLGGVFGDKTSSHWECELDGRRAQVTWKNHGAPPDLSSTITIEYPREGGETGRHSETFRQRRFTEGDLNGFAEEHGLSLAKVYGDFDMTVGVDDRKAWRSIYVFTQHTRRPVRKD